VPPQQIIAGPAGPLEVLIETPPDFTGGMVAVICHPHPLHGGTLTNKVVSTLARAFRSCGAETVRFNFRGVGQSAGTHDQGIGEVEDALAVVNEARARRTDAALWLAGFSFGAMVAYRAAQRSDPQWLVTVAPAVRLLSESGKQVAPDCPWLIVQGDADEIVAPREVAEWAAGFAPPPKLELLAGGGHFFHGRLNELHDIVVASRPKKEKPG